MPEVINPVTAQLATVLRGEPKLESSDWFEAGEAFVTAAAEHGIEPLLREHLQAAGEWIRVPAGVRSKLEERTRGEVALEGIRRIETSAVLDGLHGAGVPALVLKGGALAYTHYAMPWLRPREDADVLVRKSDRELAAQVLGRLGYDRVNSLSRDAVHTQWMFQRCRKSVPHVVDLHWAVSNRPLFAEMLSFEELLADATPVAALSAHALGPGPVHALLFACIHRVAHHGDCDNLLWLYDIKLLAGRMTQLEWDRFWDLAVRKQVLMLCSHTLALADGYVGCSYRRVSRPLETMQRGRSEPSARYLGGALSTLHSLVLDVRDSPSHAARLRLLASHAFPDPAYMRAKYSAGGQAALAMWYARRGATALWRLVMRRAA